MKAFRSFLGIVCILAFITVACLPVFSLGLFSIFDPAVAFAQTSAPAPAIASADTTKQTLIKNVLDALLSFLPVAMSFLAAYITHGVGLLWGKLSPTTAASLSAVIGGLVAAICAAIFPGVLPPDVAATLGAGGGAVGHAMSQKSPIPTA